MDLELGDKTEIPLAPNLSETLSLGSSEIKNTMLTEDKIGVLSAEWPLACQRPSSSVNLQCKTG